MIHWEIKDQICELVLSHEPCNEIGTYALEQFEMFLKELQSYPEVRSLLVYSTLAKGFCAGADLRELYQNMMSRPKQDQSREIRHFLDRIHKVMNAMDDLPMTTIAVVHGVCFGGGFELALTFDIRIAEATARFCFPELRLGIIPGFGGIPRLQRDVGNGVIRDLLLTGRSINAQKAKLAGLVSQTVASGEGLEVGRRMAVQAVKFDPEATVTAKRFLKPIPYEMLEKEKSHFLHLFQKPALQQALKKFIESEDLRPYLP